MTDIVTRNNHLRAAIADGGFELSECRRCGKPVIWIGAEPPMCRQCVEEVEE